MHRKYLTEMVMADEAGIARAARILRDGGLVAVPTETVYGWVPADTVIMCIDSHGGMVEGELPPLVKTKFDFQNFDNHFIYFWQ